jgi:glutathione S-transferase
MSEFIVHTIPGSPFARSVLATLEEKGAIYRLARVSPGTMRSAEHLARHPFGRVPVLEHDGFWLYETQAILRYLDRVLPMHALTPSDPKCAARMDQVMNINDWYLFHGVGNVIVCVSKRKVEISAIKSVARVIRVYPRLKRTPHSGYPRCRTADTVGSICRCNTISAIADREHRKPKHVEEG